MIKTTISALLLCTASLSTWGDTIPLAIDGAEATSIGIYIKDLSSDEVVADYNAQLALTPASVTKAITTATALNILGTDYTFSTAVELTGSAGASGVWNGNLVIRSCGDPTLGSPELKMPQTFSEEIIDGLKKLGITSISGTVVIDQSLSDPGPIPQWEVEDLGWAYGAGLFGFNWAGNIVRAYPATDKTVPASTLKIKTYITKDGHTDVLRGINSERVDIWTSAKNARNPKWSVNTTVPDPAYVYSGLLKGRLRAAGIKISNTKSTAAAKQSLTVCTHRSRQLAEICRDLMKRSDNLFAEGVLRAIAPGKSRKDAINAEKTFWKDLGINTDYSIINDGSGLTRANRISPLMLGDILQYMARSPLADAYLDCFPVSGTDGTLKSFLKDTPLHGRLALKTGSVSSVQTYAGYFLDREGKPSHIVVIMVTGFFCPRKDLRTHIQNYLLNIFNEHI